MILIAFGANLPGPYGDPPPVTFSRAKEALSQRGVRLLAHARIWLSAPVPYDPDQPWYHNTVCSVDTDLTPDELLQTLLEVEKTFGRKRMQSDKNAPRTLDLDLLSYHDRVVSSSPRLELPHPRLHERAFVLIPLREIAPDWVHPVLQETLDALIEALPEDQRVKPLEEKL